MKQMPILTLSDELKNSERRYIPIEYVEVALKELLITAMLRPDDIEEEIEKLLNELKEV
mgnify:CR=1 FL=1